MSLLVDDVNDNAPQFQNSPYSTSISEVSLKAFKREFFIIIPPVYEVYRGYIVFAFSVCVCVCVSVCLCV